MNEPLKTTTTVQNGGRVEIIAPDLAPGTSVEVTIQVAATKNGVKLASINQILAGYQTGRLFKDAKEVDAYLQAE